MSDQDLEMYESSDSELEGNNENTEGDETDESNIISSEEEGSEGKVDDLEENSEGSPNAEKQDDESDEMPKGLKKRFGKLISEKKRIEAENKRLKEQTDKINAEAQRNNIEALKEIDFDTGSRISKPVKEDFEDGRDYAEALFEYKSKKDESFNKHMQAINSQSQKQKKIQDLKSNYESRKDSAREMYPDFDEVNDLVFNNENFPIHELVGDAILNSNDGHHLAYYLGKNANKAYELFQKLKTNPYEGMKELGKIEAMLSTPQRVSKKPKPPTPSERGNQSFNTAPSSKKSSSDDDLLARIRGY